MQLLSLNRLFLSVVLLATLSVAIQTPAGRFSQGPAEAARRNAGGAFPFLTRLRNNALEFIFGRPPSRSRTSSQTYGPSQSARYLKETVLRFNFTGTEEATALQEAVDRLFLDVWDFTHDHVDIRVRKDETDSFLSLLPKSLRQKFSTLVPDLASAVWATYPTGSFEPEHRLFGKSPNMSTIANLTELDMGPKIDDNIFFQDYQPLTVINRWMGLVEGLFPLLAERITVGYSSEGRNITGLRIGTKLPPAQPKLGRKTILITGGLHAREWISTSTVNYVAWSLLTEYGRDHMVTRMLHYFDFVLVPVVNVDGYEFTWNTDRLWRKTRQSTNLRYCQGLDLDHAFGYEWNQSTAEPCSEAYGGEEAFQAVEARTLSDWAQDEILNKDVHFIGFLDFHSYSQQILYPYSFSCQTYPGNLENLEELGIGIAKAIRNAPGEHYTMTSACEGVTSDHVTRAVPPRIESGGGSAIDWFYHVAKARFSYQVKLRDTGSYGFLLPRSEIVPTGREVFHALSYYGDFLLGNDGRERSAHGTEREATPNDFMSGDHPWTELRR